MDCKTCRIRPVLKDRKICIVCYSVERGIPHEDLEGEDFESFKHHMRKIQKEKDAEIRKEAEAVKRHRTHMEEAMEAIARSNAIGEWVDPRVCASIGCDYLMPNTHPHEICATCRAKHLWNLQRFGLPVTVKKTTEPVEEIKGYLID